MSETPQQNEQLAKSISGFLDKYGNKLFSGVKTVYKKAYDESRINWRLGYENYLEKHSTNTITPKLFWAITTASALRFVCSALGRKR